MWNEILNDDNLLKFLSFSFERELQNCLLPDRKNIVRVTTEVSTVPFTYLVGMIDTFEFWHTADDILGKLSKEKTER